MQKRLGLDPSGSNAKVVRDSDGNLYVIDGEDGHAVRLNDIYGGVGRIVGSSLANYLFHDAGTLTSITTSTVLGSIGQALGNVIGLAGNGVDLSTSFEAAFANFDQTLFSNLKATGTGALSSFTTLELGRAFGLHGFGAELFSQVAGSAVNPVYNEVLNNIFAGRAAFDHFSLSSVFGPNASFDSVFGPSIGSFFGAQLGALVISPTTSAGAVLSSIGSSVGAFVAGKVLSSLGNVIAPGVGAFVGFVLGTLIGNLFGHQRPRIPSASAETTLLLPFARYGVGGTVSANGGDLGFATAMAEAARDTLNGIIAQITGGTAPAYVSNLYSPTQSYGYSGSQIYVKLGGAQVNVASADQAVSKGVLWALPQTQVIGGDLFLKRALVAGTHTDITTLLGDLQVAADYSTYLRNRAVINEMLQRDPQSAFSASWIVTLGRAVEIGVTTFKSSDFFGGLQGFLQSFGVSGAGSQVHYEDVSISLSGGALTLTANGPAGAGLFSLLPQADASGSTLTIANFGGQVGYLEQYIGNRSTANDIEIAAPGSGAVSVYAGSPGYYNGYYGSYGGNDGGSDIIVGAGGNDYLAAGSGGDWIDGQGGDDLVYGGSGADVLIGGYGADQMFGGGGRDYMAGGGDNDYLDGGGSADVLVGGAGSDTLHGGDGNDILIVDEDMGGTYDLLDGGNGNDTASFERFSAGVYADISAQGPSNLLTVQQAGFSLYRNQSIYSPDGRYRFTFQSDQNLVLYGPGNAVLWAANTRNNGGDRVTLSADGNLVMSKSNGSIKWQSYSGGHSGATITLDNAGQLNIDDQDGTAYWTVGGGGYVEPVTSSIYGDQWQSIENVTGSKYDDNLVGTNHGSTLKGLAGNDVLRGGDGSDVLDGGEGADLLLGGSGSDTASYSSSSEGVYVSLFYDNTIVDQEFYYANNPDVAQAGVDATEHYNRFGWREGRAPNANFDTSFYIASNQDVASAGINPLTHYKNFGKKENRSAVPLSQSGDRQILFDDQFYLRMYPDVARAGIDPRVHYEMHGRYEGRKPSAFFDTEFYLRNSPDVAAAGINPLAHFNSSGTHEGRAFSSQNLGIGLGGDATGDNFVGIENISGSTFGDRLEGDEQANIIKAGFGDDRIDATAGADTYDGGDGFDTLDYSATTFVSGTSTFEYGGYPYTYTSPALTVNLSEYGSSASYRDANGFGGYQTLTSIEQVIGTASDDSFWSSGTSISMIWNGGAGADTFYGGDGSDTYVFGHGYGVYTISDTSAAANALRMNADVTFDDLWVANAGGTLQVGIRGEAGYLSVYSNFAAGNNVIKTLDMGRAGDVDLTLISAVYGGSDGAEGIGGDSSTSNLIFAYGGDDTIYAANGTYSYQGSVIYAGTGNDVVYSSVGDDQFLFERGNGRDYVMDGGGRNTVVFGSTVSADDVIYQVVGNDLFIGVRDLNNADLAASQVADSIQIVGGAVKNVGSTYGTTSWNTTFTVKAGGATTDLTKANIPWAVNYYDDSYQGGGGGYGGYGGYGGPRGGYIPPIILDLTDDGLEITPVDQSEIVTKDAAGNVLRTSWVGPTNGILAYDRNGDGRVDNTGDISFKGDRKGARTDLEGLAGWDDNGDGILSALDAGFAKLVVWTDANQDGRQDVGEVASLLVAGVESLDLKGKPTGFDGRDTIDTIVHNTTTFKRVDGSTGTAYDVSLARRALDDGSASSILGSRDLGGLAQFGRIGSDSRGSMSVDEMLGLASSFSRDGSKGAAIDAVSAARWAHVLDPDAKAARRALLSGGMRGEDALGLIRSTRAHGDEWAPLFGRAVRTSSNRMQAIVVDFDRSGPSFVDPGKSRVFMDVARAGEPVQVGWLQGSDGVLAFDADGNGRVSGAGEIDLTGRTPNAKSAFQGLRSFDTDRNGTLSAADAEFAKFVIWRDRNGNGQSEAGELQSLSQAGIVSFDLTGSVSRSAFGKGDANEVLGIGKVVFSDGSTRASYDVALGYADADSDPGPVNLTPRAKSDIIGSDATYGAGGTAGEEGGSSKSASPSVAVPAIASLIRASANLSGPGGQVVTADAPAGSSTEWWRDAAIVGGTLAALSSSSPSSGAEVGANRGGMTASGVGAAQMQRLQLLRQNMAAMGGDAGGAAAVWTRGAANDAALAIPSPKGDSKYTDGAWSRVG